MAAIVSMIRTVLQFLWGIVQFLWDCVYVVVQALPNLFKRMVKGDRRQRLQALKQSQSLPKVSLADVVPNASQILLTTDGSEFIFHFNQEGLVRIQTARSQNLTLQAPVAIISQLRQASLAEIVPPPPRPNTPQNIGTAFSTAYYAGISYHHGKPQVVRTVISLDGDVIQQICRDYLAHPQFAAIVSAHHWLATQLLQQLRLSLAGVANMVMGGMSAIAFLLTLLHHFQDLLLQPIHTLDTMLPFLTLSLLPAVIWRLFRQQLLPWLNRTVLRWVMKNASNQDSGLRKFATWGLHKLGILPS
jgi:hypothetical protein